MPIKKDSDDNSLKDSSLIDEEDKDYITDNSINLLDNVQSKIKYIINNDVNQNDVRLIVNSDSNVFFLSLFSNYLNIIKHYKLNKELQYKIIQEIINNNAISELYNSKIFLNQTWELNNYLSEIGIISNMKLLKYNQHFYNKTQNPIIIKYKNYIPEHHYGFNKMAQDEGYFNRRKTFLNNNIQVNDLQSLYYIDKITNRKEKEKIKIISPEKKNKYNKISKTKLSEEQIKRNKILQANEKINQKVTDYISSVI